MQEPIAIVGVATILPGGGSLREFWETVREARDCFRDVPEAYWRVADYFDPTPRAPDRVYARRGAFVDPVPFDALEFGVPPSALPATDAAQLLALVAAARCLRDAEPDGATALDRARTSVILGASGMTQLAAHMSARSTMPNWRQGLRDAGFSEAEAERACAAIAAQFVPWQESTFPGMLTNVIAGRIANRFDLGGANFTVDAACASSLAAIAMAVSELRAGRADTVLTGGVDALNDIVSFLSFSQTPALSVTGQCRPFSADADGTMLGEGVALFALRRLSDAKRDGHRVYALIRGVGSSSDGRAKSIYAPRAEGQRLALARAYDDAGYHPATVELVEAHGTGTIVGDAAEVDALRQVFAPGGAAAGAARPCALGSVKSQIGHTKAAAGAASLAKVVLSLLHRTLPPTCNVDRPNPAVESATGPFYLNTEARPWFSRPEHPRRASVSSFGFGGSNFHLAVEEYRGEARVALASRGAAHLLLLSASDDGAMREALTALRGTIAGDDQLRAVARGTHATFDPGARVRVAIVVGGAHELDDLLRRAADLAGREGDERRAPGVIWRTGAPATPGQVAFVFPGQGSQYLGMGRELALQFPDAFDAWERAHHAVHADGVALGDMVFPPRAFTEATREEHEARLRRTEWAQPALAAMSLAQLALLDRVGLRPAAVAGHSFGELVALCSAGALDDVSLLELARARGEAMARAAASAPAGDAGGMLAVAAGVDAVAEVLAASGEPDVVIANDNHPAQVVVSGPTAPLDRVGRALDARGLRCQRLPVAAAFHSPVVAPAADAFARVLASTGVHEPAIPVIANGSGTPYGRSAAEVRDRLATQLVDPVRFRECIEALHARGCTVFVEVGAGRVLTGLVDRCLAGRPHAAIALDAPGTHGVRMWWQAMGELATLGLPMTLSALAGEAGGDDRDTSPSPGAHVVAVGGLNLGKPFPPVMPDLDRNAPAVGSRQVVPAVVTTSPDAALVLEAHRMTQQALLDSLTATLHALSGTTPDLAAPGLAVPHAMHTPEPFVPAPPVAMRHREAGDPDAAVTHDLAVTPTSARPAATDAEPDLPSTVLGVIAEKTGYPPEALRPELDLEADLGIDSIKRVEILAVLSDRFPGFDASHVNPGQVRRIGDLVSLLAPSAPGSGNGAHPERLQLAAAPAERPAPDGTPVAVARHQLAWEAADAPGHPAPEVAAAATIATVDAGDAFAEGLREALAEGGIPLTIVEPAKAEVIVVAPSTDDRATVPRVFAALRAIATAAPTPRLLVGALPDSAVGAALGGMLRSAAREWGARCICIEMPSGVPAAALARELCRGGGAAEVRLHPRRSERIAREMRPAHEARDIPEGPWVVTGGARGVTASCLRQLAAAGMRRVLILGRTALADESPETMEARDEGDLTRILLAREGPGADLRTAGRRASAILAAREVRATLAALAASGVDARYASVDATRDAEVATAVAAVRRDWGPIRGVIHAAGRIIDRPLESKTDEQFSEVLDTKWRGAESLLSACAGDPLEMVCLFSSVAAAAGNPGQTDYAAGNAALDRIAEDERARRAGACHVVSIEWGPWAGGMVGSALARHFASLGVALLPLDAGASAFVEELRRGDTAVVSLAARGAATMDTPGLVREVSVTRMPELVDHAIAGTPVVPMTVVLDWVADLAVPDPSRDLAIRDFALLHGIRLDAGPVDVRLTALADGVVECRHADGRPAYRAIVLDATDAPPPPPSSPPTHPASWAPCYDDPYRESLFHGPAFRVIRRILGAGPDGVTAELATATAMGWSGRWRLDPLAMDGALQLLRLWAWSGTPVGVLPTAIGRIRTWGAWPRSGRVICQLEARREAHSRVVGAATFSDPHDGRVVARLDDIVAYAEGG